MRDIADSPVLDELGLLSSSMITLSAGGAASLVSLARPSKLKNRGRAAAAPPGRLENEGSYDIDQIDTTEQPSASATCYFSSIASFLHLRRRRQPQQRTPGRGKYAVGALAKTLLGNLGLVEVRGALPPVGCHRIAVDSVRGGC